jgi:hypothetical protein
MLEKHMNERGFTLEKISRHCTWINKDGIKITTSCTPKPSQYENTLKQIDREIRRKTGK